MSLDWRIWLLCACALLPVDREHEGGVVTVIDATSGGVFPSSPQRVEHFVLERPGTEPVGLVEWRERIVDGGVVLERDVTFAHGKLRLSHVERLTSTTRRLVWREKAPGVARSQITEPSRDEGGLLVLDWLEQASERSVLDGSEGALYPLEFAERLRRQTGEPFRQRVFSPLSRRVEEMTVRAQWLSGAENCIHGRRIVELIREDGSLSARYLFDGDALEGIQWQNGGPWARRVDSKTYDTFIAKMAPGVVEASGPSK